MGKRFYHCGKCNKRLIERLPNGLWKFIFGRDKNKNHNPPVQLLILGNIKIRCFRRTKLEDGSYLECGHWNTFNFWPHRDFINQPEEAEESLAETNNQQL